ncbi:WD40 repeat domain-containing protein, partial [Streptomyces sp. NPDC058622]|uniref:WD40 repeat domain-containing protein n=1 Tax=Streptomyces sp. NPDC058622 TaxID=3346562 RepID=UPI0036571524
MQETEQRITRWLADQAHKSLACRRQPPLYTRRHGAEHAAAGGRLGEVFTSEILPFLDADRLRQLAPDAVPGGLEPADSHTMRLWGAFRRVAHLWDFQRPEANAAALEMWAAATGGALPGSGTGQFWRVDWALWPTGAGEVLARTGAVEAVGTGILPDGRTVLCCGGWDRVVRVWDLATHRLVGKPLTGHRGAVTSLETCRLPGRRAIVVTGSIDGTVRRWDLLTGKPMGMPRSGHTGTVTAVATTMLRDGHAVAVTGGHDARMWMWDLETGEPVSEPLTGHAEWITAVATTALPDGRIVALTGSKDRTLRLWDLEAGQAIGKPLTGHTD